ncbi:MmgE/PrpD family protein [Rhodococcus sp. MEB041]|uniref:MmgE/PrpD family protein n=1 Tax=Rhodococcus sp. MEB041 TaxID=3040323 RepID=UPI00254DCD98|nr:MmgE/PrpD family protein [Rhodococcus sp. MEB041]
MTDSTAFLPAEQVRMRIDDLARFCVDLPATGTAYESRIRTVLLDLLGVTLAGARTPELTALLTRWRAEPGTTATVGRGAHTGVETAAYLDAIASCCLELDEGNKYAAGHPAAHVLPAAVAAARLSAQPVSGDRFVAAVVAGYEVATRFGAALTRDPKWHTHGHWGATGAAAAAAVVWDLDAERTAAAIDASTALVHVAPWAVVLAGNFGRNLWIGGAVRAGLDAARLSSAGLVHNSGAAATTLGDIVGTLDADRLAPAPDGTFALDQGYAKRHASCSYTHAAVDIVHALRTNLDTADIASVRVRTHALAEPLFGRHPSTRLGAMFSLPFVVSAAVVAGSIDVETLTPGSATFRAAEEFSARVDVESSPALTALLPDRRAAEVDIVLVSGETVSAGSPDPVGDVDHFPLDHAQILEKIERLVGAEDAGRIDRVVTDVLHSSDVVRTLTALP